MAVKGHPRLFISVPIVCDFLLMISSNILVLFCTVSEMRDLLAENCEFSLRHSHLKPSLGGGEPLEFLDEPYTAKTRVLGISIGDGQTDGRTDMPTIANAGLCIESYADAL